MSLLNHLQAPSCGSATAPPAAPRTPEPSLRLPRESTIDHVGVCHHPPAVPPCQVPDLIDARVIGYALTGRATSPPPHLHRGHARPTGTNAAPDAIVIVAVEPPRWPRTITRLPLVIAAVITAPTRSLPHKPAAALDP